MVWAVVIVTVEVHVVVVDHHWCVQVGAAPRQVGLACLCLGHTAQRFGRLSDEAVALAKSLAARADADQSDVDGRALDGYDDIRTFLHLW